MKKHKKTREIFTWGQNYNAEGERLSTTIHRNLKDISDSHLEAIILFFENKIYNLKGNKPKILGIITRAINFSINNRIEIYKKLIKLFKTESRYRIINNITVKDYD